MVMEDKIINDVLIYLDGWVLQNKPHKTRHKPHPPKYIEPFNETSEDIEETNVRKSVTSKEIMDMYEVAKIHVLNYIKRPVFPRTPTTHIAICMWTAGLLSQKARFRKQRIENSYNLIKEAKELLKPHIAHNVKISTIGKRPEPLDDVEYYTHEHYGKPHCKPKKRLDDCGCNKDHVYKGRKHKCPPHPHPHPPKFEHDEPEWDSFFLKRNHVVLKILPARGELGVPTTLKAIVRDVYGNRVDEGRVRFYLEYDEED